MTFSLAQIEDTIYVVPREILERRTSLLFRLGAEGPTKDGLPRAGTIACKADVEALFAYLFGKQMYVFSTMIVPNPLTASHWQLFLCLPHTTRSRMPSESSLPMLFVISVEKTRKIGDGERDVRAGAARKKI